MTMFKVLGIIRIKFVPGILFWYHRRLCCNNFMNILCFFLQGRARGGSFLKSGIICGGEGLDPQGHYADGQSR